MATSEVILNGSLFLAAPIALLAGLVSFLSPCILPLVPGYLGFVSGIAATKSRVVLGTSLFVAGFGAVFVALGSLAGLLGPVLRGSTGRAIEVVFGLLIIAFGFVLMGQIAWLQRTIKPQVSARLGLIGAPLLGLAFGIGWTPCIGPTLSAVLALASDSASPWRGAILSIFYTLGLGLPFVLLAAGFGWATRSVGFVKRHIRGFNIAGGALLITLGVLFVSGLWQVIIGAIQEVTIGFVPSI